VTRRSLPARWFCLGMAALLAGMAGVGCTSTPSRPSFERPEPMPTALETTQRFNARVSRLDRIWASAVITLRTPKESGGTRLDQAEGYLQIEQPDRTSLSIMKLGETYFYMGSDERGYWWLDRSDSSRRIGLYGLHEEATPEIVASLGLPVHPQELLELFAVTPLPSGVEGSRRVAVAWDESLGLLRVETPARWGSRIAWLDPILFSPQRTELRDERGNVRAVCEMGRYASVPVRGDGRVPPKMASQYRVEFPGTEARATLELYGLTNKPISERAFDFPGLVEAYDIEEVYLLRPDGAMRLGPDPDAEDS
jgi:hypothetical protein